MRNLSTYKIIEDFKIKFQNGEKEFFKGGTLELMQGKAVGLIKCGKIAGLKDGEFLSLHKYCMQKLSKIYISGTYEFTENNSPDLSQKLGDIETKIDGQWGKDIKVFQETLDDYFNHNLKLISIFKERSEHENYYA